MTLSPDSRIVVVGAGSIGCYLGGRLAAAGRNVTLLLREPLAQAIAAHGLRVSDLEGNDETVPASSLTLATESEPALVGADVVLVTVKYRHTREVAEQIARHAGKDAIVLTLQNGINNGAILREAVRPAHRVVAGTIPFNVVQTRKEGEAPRFHRGKQRHDPDRKRGPWIARAA